jgi:hypothetical protein
LSCGRVFPFGLRPFGDNDVVHLEGGSSISSCVALHSADHWLPVMWWLDGPLLRSSAGPTVDAVTDVSAGAAHGCLVRAGEVWCVGDDRRAQLTGHGATWDVPGHRIEIPCHATQIESARDTSCARCSDGAVWCWGGNDDAQLGRRDSTVEQPIQLAAGATDVAVTMGRVCVLVPGQLECWGWPGRDDGW